MAKSIRIFTLCAMLCIGACKQSTEQQIASHCKKLITDSLVAPSTASFIRSALYHKVASEIRRPAGMPDLEEHQAEIASLTREVEYANRLLRISATDPDNIKRFNDAKSRVALVQANQEKINSLLAERASLPWGEVYWELDSQNRSGAMLRSIGVCTWQDDGTPWPETIELSYFGDGRIPASPPSAFQISEGQSKSE